MRNQFCFWSMNWELKHPKATYDMLGYLPSFLREEDPRSAKEQFDTAYVSGWQSFEGFRMNSSGELTYPGDPPMRLLAETKLRDEVVRLYESSWVAIIQPDGAFEVARLD